MSWEEYQGRKAELKAAIQRDRNACRDTDLAGASRSLEQLPEVKIRARRVLRGHISKVYAIHWSEDSRHLVSASQDGNLLVWDAVMQQKTRLIPLKSSWVMTCAYSPTGRHVASGGLDNIATIYNVDDQIRTPGEHAQILGGHTGYISCCRFLPPDDGKMVTSSGDGTCRLWDVSTGSTISEFAGHKGDVMFVSIGANPNIFVSGACDGMAKVWDLRDGKCKQTFGSGEDNAADVNAVEFFPDGNAFATAADDGSCNLFDLRSDQSIQVYKTETKAPNTSVAFSRSGRLLFVGSDNCNCNIFDTLKGERRGIIAAHEARVSCVSVPRDGSAVATGSWDSVIRIFN
eukprot:m.452064 g.452064  ORF g.452064 m.452064 type:complete len:345 (-) comp20262_c0_seq1:270-1304(-)